MVAEALPATSKRKATNRSGRGPDLPVLTIARVRNLYVSQCIGPSEIARQTGLTPKQVQNLISRKGWAELHKKRKQTIVDSAILQDSEQDRKVVNAIGDSSSVLSLATLGQSGAVLERVAQGDPNAPRDLQALSQAAKNFVGIFRQARALDVQAEQASGSTTNVFFLSNLTPAPRILKDVTGSASIDTAPVSPVTAQATQDSVSTVDVQVSPPAVGGPPGA